MENKQHNPYRLKHKPTGLYFKPLDGGSSNLSKRGKIYYNDYAYNQLTKDSDYFQGFGHLELYVCKGPHKRETDYLFEIGQKIHNGEYPELKLKYDYTDKDSVRLSIINNPEHWEKEYLNITAEPVTVENIQTIMVKNFEGFKNSVYKGIEDYPKEWRLGQKVFNYIDAVYGVVREVQFEDHVDCFYDDSMIDLFIKKAWKKIESMK